MGIVWLAIATSSIVHIEPAPADLLTVAALGLFFVLGMRVPPGFGMAGLLLAIFLVCNAIAAAFTVDPLATIRYMSVRFYLVASFLLFTCLIYQNPRRVLPVLWSAYIVACLIAATFGAAAYFGFIDPGNQLLENNRVRAFFKDPNVYGPFLVPVAMYAIAQLETAPSKRVLLYMPVLIACAIGVLLGFSRGAYINFVTAFLIYLVVRLYTQRNPYLRNRVLKMTALMLLGGIMAIGGMASTNQVQSMLDKRLKVVQYYDTGEGGRMTRQLEVVKKIAVNPVGIGPGESFKDYYFGNAPHNLYLHTMIESGWIGGLAYIAFLFLTLARATRYIRRSANIDGAYIAVYASVFGVLIQSVFVDSTHWRHFYLLFSILWGQLLYWESRVRQSTGLARAAVAQTQIHAV
ncbi:MAG: O-antigen ligase family protein [Gammaproteobacteria bacterium]|jgi:O-antigen ligase